jgi:diguanylate cyclase (GGDEF)-like protein
MIETVAPAQAPAQTGMDRGRIFTLIVQASLLLGETLALLWLVERAMSDDWVQATCLGQFILAMAAASAALYCAARRRRRLYDPIDRLEKILPGIRAGRAPIEDLLSIKGQLAPIAMHMHEMLREIRGQKSMLSEMDHEVRQRIANRTEALERKIGSLQNQATRDVLTGLLNRRALNEHLAKVIERNVACGSAVSVLMIDVDNFKPLNDTLGHAAGDELLRSMGQLFRSTLRETDAAFRCGGDEFVIVLDGSDIARANEVAERIGKTIDALVKPLKVPALPRLSIGAASLGEVSPATAAALLEEADKRLYVKKGARKRGSSPAPAAPPAVPATPAAKPQLRKSA